MRKPRKRPSAVNHHALDHEVLGTATVGARGQVVIPSDVRRGLNLSAGDKLLVMVRADTLCMVKAEMLRGMINRLTRQLGKFNN